MALSAAAMAASTSMPAAMAALMILLQLAGSKCPSGLASPPDRLRFRHSCQRCSLPCWRLASAHNCKDPVNLVRRQVVLMVGTQL